MEDRVKLTADDSDYQNVMRRAGNTAEQFTGRVNHASNAFTNIFKRSPNMRAERALSGFFERAASGDIAGAIQQISGRMTGLGIVAGVAIGAGVAIFEKFKSQIDETRAAHEALQTEMARRPLATITSLSSEGMEQALQAREKLAEDLRKKGEHTLGSELFAGLQTSPNDFLDRGAPKSEQERMQAQKDLNRETVEGKKIMLAQAELAVTMLGLRRQELEGDERSAKIAQVILEAEQKRAALKGKGITAKAFAVADEAISENAELTVRQINKQADGRERSLKAEEKMIKFVREGASIEDQKKLRGGLDIELLDKQIATEQSPLLKRALKVQRDQKINEMHGLFTVAPKNPFAFGTAAARNFETNDPKAFGSLAQRTAQQNDPLAFGSLANSAMNRGDTPLVEAEKKSPDVVSAVDALRVVVEKAWMEP
jgi:hypothetical protein